LGEQLKLTPQVSKLAVISGSNLSSQSLFKKIMKRPALLHDYSFLLFGAFLSLALIAFWPGYFSRIGQESDFPIHAHAWTMTAWCVLLVVQAVLIRMKKFKIHRWAGRLSFILVPLVLVSGVLLVYTRLSGGSQFSIRHYYSTALMLNSLVVFALLFALAILFRKNINWHARFMISTIFPAFTPITDRLISYHYRELIPNLPKIGGLQTVQSAGFIMADSILLLLVLWDLIANRRIGAFAIALALVLIYQFSVFYFHRYEFWREFTAWFLS
jgi:uncharacterized membrane protein